MMSRPSLVWYLFITHGMCDSKFSVCASHGIGGGNSFFVFISELRPIRPRLSTPPRHSSLSQRSAQLSCPIWSPDRDDDDDAGEDNMMELLLSDCSSNEDDLCLNGGFCMRSIDRLKERTFLCLSTWAWTNHCCSIYIYIYIYIERERERERFSRRLKDNAERQLIHTAVTSTIAANCSRLLHDVFVLVQRKDS